jgi:glycine oxidase
MKIAIMGGGVIGLSLAYELCQRSHDITLIDRGRMGRQSSWAGAGVFPPSNAETAIHPIEQLEARSDQLHPIWADRLLRQTGIDNQFTRCGGLYVARTTGEKAALAGVIGEWQQRNFDAIELSWNQRQSRFGSLPCLADRSTVAWWLPGETQICNPLHLEALIDACSASGVTMLENCGDVTLQRTETTVTSAHLPRAKNKKIEADVYCVTAGAWAQHIVEEISMVPIRGQMLLYKLDAAPFEAVINEGSRYLVPRRDGHVLFGATIEEAGFNTETTATGLANLQRHAEDLLPTLAEDKLVKTWAGLRPATFDGFPYIGPLTGYDNAMIAAGHFKAGLHLAPATAEVIADLIDGKQPSIDLRPFAPSRTSMSS